MGEEKKKKKKKKESQDNGEPPQAEEAPPPPAEEDKKSSKKSSKKKSSKKRSSVRATSGAFAIFSEEMMVTFKKGFDYIDFDGNGIIDKEDIRRAYDKLGKIAKDEELDELMDEPPAPVTFTMFLTMFGEKMGAAGEADDDKLIKFAFKAFDVDKVGGIDPVHFEDYLSNWGDPFTPAEVQLIFPQLPLMGEDAPSPEYAHWISVSHIVRMLTGGEDDQETGVSSSEG